MIKKGSFRFATLEQLPGWNAVMGLQFENLVCNNVREILRQIGLERTLVPAGSIVGKFDLSGIAVPKGWKVSQHGSKVVLKENRGFLLIMR